MEFNLVIKESMIVPVPSSRDAVDILMKAMANNVCPQGEFDGSGILFPSPEQAQAAMGGLEAYLAGDPGF